MAILVAVCLVGCDEPSEGGGHCYVIAGLYLLGDDWPPVGFVEDVFNTYNDDENLKYFYERQPATATLWSYQDRGYQVVVGYFTDGIGGYHYRPMSWHENIKPDSAYIAGYFGR